MALQVTGLVTAMGATLAQAMQAANQPLVEAVQQGIQAQAAMLAAFSSASSGSASAASGSASSSAAEAFNQQMDRWMRERRRPKEDEDAEELLCMHIVEMVHQSLALRSALFHGQSSLHAEAKLFQGTCYEACGILIKNMCA